MRRAIRLTLLALLPFCLWAQTLTRMVAQFPVIIEDDTLSMPFSGGFNGPIPQFLDWDHDGFLDLFITDGDGRIQQYETDGSGPESFTLLTRSFNDLLIGFWFYFIDYDLDGDHDLIHSSVFPAAGGAYAFVVYENIEGTLIFRTERLLDDQGRVLTVSSVVIPTFTDIDGDDWADLFIGSVAGSVTKYRNLGMRNSLPLFQFETNTFQNIMLVWSPGRGRRHGASALEFFDIDADGDKDLFWGDLYQPSLFFLENIGTSEVPVIPDSLVEVEYPSQSPLKTAGFNVPRFSDLDDDGDSELFAGVQSGVYGTNFVKNFVYYTNKGSDTLANFIYERDNFLEILDLGSASVPVFADIDLDGDEDLFIGNEYNDELPGLRGTVFFFRNIGEIESPVFKLEDSTFFPDLNGNNLAPTFGDLDSDGDLDAVVGDWNGKLYYCENSGTPESPSFLYKGQFLDTDVGGLAHPALGDLDFDGDLDLIVGQDDGLIYYFINIGTSSQSILELQSENFFPNANLGVQAAPYLVDLDDDGDLDILIGNAAGELFFAKQEIGIWSVTKITHLPYSGPQTSPATAHLNGDGEFELVLGTWHGGLQLYQMDMNSAAVEFTLLPTEVGLLNIYPNTFNRRLTVSLTIPSAETLNISVWNLLGEKVGTISEGPLSVGRHRFSWQTGDLSSGIYFVRAESDGGTKPWHTVRKVIYLK